MIVLFVFLLFCSFSHCGVPVDWTCSTLHYNTSDGCHCNCGAYDPDCDKPNQEIENCASYVTSCNFTTGNCDYPDNLSNLTGWTCAEDHYKDGEYCDCDCGIYDPDCDNSNLPIYGCESHVTECSIDGTCKYDYPAEWTCSRSSYNGSDGCNCGCGAYDPDCDDSSQSIVGCSLDPAALSCDVSSGVCVYPSTPPDSWSCSASLYNSEDYCVCECGAYSPSCDDEDITLFGCATSAVGCDFEGHCIYDPSHLWTCDLHKFEDGATCDCDCGMWDPDCSNTSFPISGCDSSGLEVSGCSSEGYCEYVVPDEWICNSDFYGTRDGCDCECGFPDPDCNITSQVLYGCGLGAIGCSSDGYCVYSNDNDTLTVLMYVALFLVPPIVLFFCIICTVAAIFLLPGVLNSLPFLLSSNDKEKLSKEVEMNENYSQIKEEEDIAQENRGLQQDFVGVQNFTGVQDFNTGTKVDEQSKDFQQPSSSSSSSSDGEVENFER